MRERRWAMHDYWFGEALGELRAGVGLQVAIIAASLGLDVDDALASTLPAPRGSRAERGLVTNDPLAERVVIRSAALGAAAVRGGQTPAPLLVARAATHVSDIPAMPTSIQPELWVDGAGVAAALYEAAFASPRWR